MKRLNLPNKLTLIRVILIPFFMFFLVFQVLPDVWSRIISAAIFLLAALTDMLDGMIARRANLITDFGKFLDPLADKLLVLGGMLGILVKNSDDVIFSRIFVWIIFIVLLRELAVTSLRLVVAGGSGIVVAASWLGKAKTVTQIICMTVLLLEPVVIPKSSALYGMNLISYITIALMTLMTVWSGLSYFKAYAPYLDTGNNSD